MRKTTDYRYLYLYCASLVSVSPSSHQQCVQCRMCGFPRPRVRQGVLDNHHGPWIGTFPFCFSPCKKLLGPPEQYSTHGIPNHTHSHTHARARMYVACMYLYYVYVCCDGVGCRGQCCLIHRASSAIRDYKSEEETRRHTDKHARTHARNNLTKEICHAKGFCQRVSKHTKASPPPPLGGVRTLLRRIY